jgi:hypothetical protein
MTPDQFRAYFDVGDETELCNCKHHVTAHGDYACLRIGCECRQFVSQKAVRMLKESMKP